MKNTNIPLAKSVFIPLRLSAALSATDAAIQKKHHGPWTTTLIISIEEMKDAIKMESKQFKMKQKNKKVNFWACY